MSKTALLLLDLQQGILERFGDDMADYLSCVSKTINAGISIIYIRTYFRPGHPEISSRNLSIARIASLGDFVEGDESVGISPSIAPLLTVLGDLCLDLDAEVHRVLVEKVFPRQARILGAEQWIQGLSSSSKE